MNNEEYIKKIQTISKILENAKCVEDVINNKELDINEDFQYICLGSSNNYELVNEVIARLVQNGNGSIIEDNIKIISMSMWKDLFNKNDSIKSIFINNFDTIYKNTSIVNYREIELFIQDYDACKYVYANLPDIISKLSTYDRAALINLLNTKENGSDIIKEHIEYFFKKGYFNITTAYAKVMKALDKTPGISKLDILRACNSELSKMLSRETAVDNETNRLLGWLYDAFEETSMDNDERASIKKNIDTAIAENFQEILEKSNYDKQTIKILKQFDCTKEQFEKSKNYFIEKSHACEIIPYRNDVEKQSDEEVQKNDEYENTEYKAVVDSNFTPIVEQSTETHNSVGVSGNTEKILIGLWTNIDQKNKQNNSNFEILQEENVIEENNDSKIVESLNCTDKQVQEEMQEVEEVNDDVQNELCNEVISEETKKADEMYMSSKDLIDSYIKKYIAKTKDNTEVSLDERLEKILVSNVEETNKIIDRVLNKKTEAITERAEKNITENANKSIINTDEDSVSIEKGKDTINNENMEFKNQNAANIDSTMKETSLLVTNQQIEYYEEKNIFIRIWEKILKLFKRYDGVDRIGE